MDLSLTESGKYKIIKLVGRVDWESARLLDTEIQKVIDGGFHHLVFNLDEVTFLCSGGIGALIYNLNKVKKQGGAIYIISSNDYVNYIFDTLKFGIVFDGLLFKSYEEFRERVIDQQ